MYEGKNEIVKKLVEQSRPGNKIQTIKSVKDGRLLTKTDDIVAEIRDFYRKLYNNDKVKSIARCIVLRCFNKKTPEEACTLLSSNFSTSEDKMAIDKLRHTSGPGPDGLIAEL